MQLSARGFPSRLLRGAVLVLPCMLASHTVWAQQSPALDRVSLWLGGYYAGMDTDISADASARGQTAAGALNLEHALGFQQHKVTPRVRLDFLLGDSQGFAIDYYRLHRTRTKALSTDIDYDGNSYLASASVKGKLDFNFGSVAYRWWFGSSSDVFGVGLGGAYYGVHAGISGEATLDGESVEASSSTSETAWAPMLQLGWRHAFSDQIRMYLDVSGVKKNGGRLSGHIYNAALGVEWLPWQHVGLGAEYGYTRIRLDQQKRNYNASLDMQLTGPSLFVRVRF